jgi:hypothetical protein
MIKNNKKIKSIIQESPWHGWESSWKKASSEGLYREIRINIVDLSSSPNNCFRLNTTTVIVHF